MQASAHCLWAAAKSSLQEHPSSIDTLIVMKDERRHEIEGEQGERAGRERVRSRR
ncbi:hypothetical protein Scep_013270 [Stephania cephalantha]|uniref:Uncharacterized protein n=1 Tax=Stephania cephalantha TaxID=152367 RepID=A0AAP0JJ15_9MAGN